MEIRVYSPELVFLGVVENFESLIWNRKYYSPGDFELHAAGTVENIKLLEAGNIITKRGSEESGVISSYEDKEAAAGGKIVRKGKFLAQITDRRIIKHTVNFSGTPEDAMRYLVSNVRPIEKLELGERKGFTGKIVMQVTWKNLQAYLTKLAKVSGLGYRIRADFRNKKLLFEVYAGVDHSTSQTENPRVEFSREMGNINDIERNYDESNYKNVFYIGGAGEGLERKIVVLGDEQAADIREVFIDAKDIQRGKLTEQEYEQALLQRGEEKAKDYNIKESAEATVQNKNFVYREHWNLGDIVTVKKDEWGVEMNKRITEVTEINENGGERIEPTFGDALPDTIDLSEG